METNKAKKYAEGKAIHALTAMIEQAYNDGYKAGYEDGLANREPAVDETDEDIQIVEQGVEYVDLGLPSGTLWSSTYYSDDYNAILFLTYNEASKLNIPTEEQFNELLKYCLQIPHEIGGLNYTKFVSRNGAALSVKEVPFKVDDTYKGVSKSRFWLRTHTDEEDSKRTYASSNSTNKIFMGYKMPVMLVKK